MLHYSTPCMRPSYGLCSYPFGLCCFTTPKPRHYSSKIKHCTRKHASLLPGHFRACNARFARDTARCFPFVCNVRRMFVSAHTLAEQLVLTGDTPVGQGLLSCQTCLRGTDLLEVPLNEVVAIAEPHLESKQKHAISAATAAYTAMPKQLMQFVQGRFKHRTCSKALCRLVLDCLQPCVGTQHPALRLAAALLWLRQHGSSFWQNYAAGLPKVRHSPQLLLQLRFATLCRSVRAWCGDSMEPHHVCIHVCKVF